MEGFAGKYLLTLKRDMLNGFAGKYLFTLKGAMMEGLPVTLFLH